MIPYILHVALLISVCLLFYKLLLQRETFYRLNRLILISCLCLSFILPCISIPQNWALTNQQVIAPDEINTHTPAFTKVEDYANPSNINQSSQTRQAQNNLLAETPQKEPLVQRILHWAFYIYWIGVAAFGLNFLLQLFVLLYQAYTKPVIKDGRFRIVELDGNKAPCSFANNIFINPSKYDWDTYNQVLLHEKIHIQQGHSLDILIAEIVLIFQWFNPFAWLYRKELENNLEFLTDDAVLDNNIEKQSYQESLLKVSAPHLSLGITTNYNQSLLKKRILMMNAKKSSIRIMWKYFFLAPLLVCLVCGLNNTIAYSQAAKNKKDDNTSSHIHQSGNRATEGSWFATIKKEKIRIEFRSDDDDHNWSNSTDFMLNEFPSLPRTQKGDFTLTREAGSILFNGKFDDDQGYGHYKFSSNKDFADFLSKQGITDMEESDLFSFFIVNVKKDYVEMLHRNGYKDVSKNELISMAALKVDEPYIQMWKQNGYKDLSPNELVSGKALNIDNAYVSEIRKAGYKDLSFNQLISFKAQHITGEYINSLQKAKLKDGKSSDENVLPDPNQLSAYKAMNIDSSYIRSFEAVGYHDIPYNELTTMKALHITPEFVKGFQEMGYKDISVNSLASLKSMNVNKDFIKSFNDIGYSKIPLNDLVTLKSLHITPEYVKSFQALGFKSIELNDLIPLKSLDITPEYINGFKKLGFTDISLKELPGLKSTGVTPEYVTSMREKGFKSNDLNKYMRLKTAFE